MGEQKIWQRVKELEERATKVENEIGQCRATMCVNFGPDGKTIKGLVMEKDTLFQMIITVFRHYHKIEGGDDGKESG